MLTINQSRDTFESKSVLSPELNDDFFFNYLLMVRKVYNKDLQDMEQPLLVHRPKDKEQQRVS